MTQENPAEMARELTRLGQVAAPEPGVLDAARETLWAAVAAEMLSAGPPAPARRAADRPAGPARRAAPREANQPGPEQDR